MMKVLHFYRTYYPDTQGGLEEVIRQICLLTRPFGVESRVLTTSKAPEPPEVNVDGVRVVRVKNQLEIASCSMSTQLFAEYKKQAEWADVINIHYPWPFADLVHLLSGVKKPVVVTYHSDIIRQKALNLFYSPLEKRFFESAKSIIATSPNYFATSRKLQLYSEKVDVIPLGLSEETYVEPSASVESLVCQEFRRPFFLFVGAMRYYKGLHILLDAAKHLACEVVIAGSGPLSAELKRKAERENISNVRFLGFIDNDVKVSLLKQCLAVVFPSHLRSEAFGVTLLEGAMYGKPLISTELGTGTSYANVDRVTGYVVPPGNAKAFREAMQRLIDNPDDASRLGLAARERFDDLFSGAVLGRNYFSAYQKLLADS